MLNMTKVGFNLISDAGMYLLFEKDLRGGVLTFLRDTVTPTIKVFKNLEPKNKNQNVLYA